MGALKNISESRGVPNDVVLKYINLYKLVGEGENYISSLESDFKVLNSIIQTKDIINLYRMFFSDAKITDARLRQFIEKKNGEVLKNKEEIMARNIRIVFDQIYSQNAFQMEIGEIADLANLLYKDMDDVPNQFRRSKVTMQPYKTELSKLIDEYNQLRKKKEIEYTYLNIAFYVDFLMLKPFKNGNELIGIIVLYCLMISSDIKSFAFSSFFEALNEKKTLFNEALNKAFYMHEEGMSNPRELLLLILDISMDAYKDLKQISRNHEFDKELSKTDAIRSAIYKLDENFKKEDIRRMVPTVSESTINRTLDELQAEGIIMSFGKGRNASWVRLDHSRDESDIFAGIKTSLENEGGKL